MTIGRGGGWRCRLTGRPVQVYADAAISRCGGGAQTHEWAGSELPTHSRSRRFVVCAPPAPSHSPSLFNTARRSTDLCSATVSAAAASLAVLLPLGATLRLLLHVRVEELLVLRSQRRADLRLLPNLERLQLVTASLVLVPQCAQSRRVALLAQRPRFLHRRLHRLAERLPLRGVLRVDRLHLRLLGVAQLEAAQRAAPLTTPPF